MATITNSVRWADNTAELKTNLLNGIGTIDAMKSSVDRVVAALGGGGLFNAANKVTAAIQEMGGITKLTTAEQERANATLDKAIEKYKTMGMTAPPAMVALKKSLDDVSTSTGGATGWLDKLGNSMAVRIAEGIALRDVFREVMSVAKDAFTEAAHIADVALATGMSTDAVQKFNYVGQEFGLTTDEMARGVEQLSGKLGTGDANATKAVQMLGLSVKTLVAEGPEQAFIDIAEAVGRINNPTIKAGVEVELFGGKLAKILGPVLDSIAQKMRDVPQAAIISKENIEKAHEFDVGLEHLETQLKAATVSVIADMTAWQNWIALSPMVAKAMLMFTAPSGQGPNTGKDIKLPTAVDDTALIANSLKSLRTDALDPLTVSQKANVLELKNMGEAEKEIAQLVGSNVVAVHLYIEANKAAAEAAKKHGIELQKLAALQADSSSSVKNLSGATIEGIKWYLQAGISASETAKVMGVYEHQVNQVKEAEKQASEERKLAAQTYVGLSEATLKWLDAQSKSGSEVESAKANFATLNALETEHADLVSQLTAGTFDTRRQKIEEWGNLEEGKLDYSVINWQTAYDKIQEVVADKMNLVEQDEGEHVRKMAEEARTQLPKGWDDAFATILKDVPNMVQSAFTGSGGISGALQSIGSKSGEALFGKMFGQITQTGKDGAVTAGNGIAGVLEDALPKSFAKAIPFIGPAIGSLIGPLLTKLMNIGGPSQAELDGRKVEASFEQQFGSFTKMQAAIGKAYADTGRSAAQANQDILTMMAAEKAGGDAATAAVAKINEAFTDQTQDAANLQAAISKYGFTIQELGPEMQKQQLDQQAQTLLNDWRLLVGSGIDVATVNTRMATSVQDYLTLAKQTGQEVPEAMQPVLQKMIDQGLLTDENGNKITDLKDLGVSFAMTMTEGLTKIVDKLDQLLQKIGMVPAALNQIPTSKDITVNTHFKGDVSDLGLPVVPMADGGIGRATGPTLFYSKGNEDYAFSGEGSSFGNGGGTGGDLEHTTVVMLDGRVLHKSVERIQTRTLRTRRKMAAA